MASCGSFVGQMPVPVPQELADAFSKAEVVAFAGAGMSRPALPGWSDLLKQMFEWARKQRIALGGVEDSIADLISQGDLLLAAQELRSRMQESNFRRFSTAASTRDAKLRLGVSCGVSSISLH
jgi:hypothetical protein